MGWVLLLIFLCIISFTAGWTTLGWILVAFFVAVGIALIWANNENQKKQEEIKQINEKVAIKKKAEKEAKIPIYNASRNDLISKYGEPDKAFVFEELNLQKEIIVFGKVNRIWLLGKDLPMSDILSCTFNDNQRIEKGDVSYETKTSTGNMAKRAIVGGVLTGGVGAVVGGATARKETTVKQENDKVIHDYTVIININSLSEPIVKIPLGADGAKVNEIVGLMNVIISRKK